MILLTNKSEHKPDGNYIFIHRYPQLNKRPFKVSMQPATAADIADEMQRMLQETNKQSIDKVPDTKMELHPDYYDANDKEVYFTFDNYKKYNKNRTTKDKWLSAKVLYDLMEAQPEIIYDEAIYYEIIIKGDE